MKILRDLAKETKASLEEVLLDGRFHKILKINIDELISHSFFGIPVSSDVTLEIKSGWKRLTKVSLVEVHKQQTLFPLFNTTSSLLKSRNLKPGVYLKQQVIGMLGKYEIPDSNFSIEKLVFEFYESPLEVNPLLLKIQYNKTALTKLKDDCLVQRQTIIIV